MLKTRGDDRGNVNVSVKGVGRNIALIAGCAVILIGCVLGVVKYLSNSKKEYKPHAELVAESRNKETLQKTETNAGLDGMMSAVLEQKKKEERKKREEEKKEEQKENKVQNENNAAASIRVSEPQPRNKSQGQKENEPLPKHLRILSGTTLVSLDDKNSSDGTTSNNDSLKGSVYDDGSVSLVIKRRYLLSAGTVFNCALKTKVVTSYGGIVKCQVLRNIYSDDGRTLLVRSGAEIIGEQVKAMQQGVARVFLNWTSIKDRNTNIRIDALGTDSLGAAGVPAWIDTHFSERFGGALMLSFIGDALDSLKNLSQNNSGNQGNITYENSTNAIGEMAKTTLDNTINIPPTAYINQGEIMSVVVPRNIDFSPLYEEYDE